MQKKEQVALVANSGNWVNKMVKFGLNCIFTVDWIKLYKLKICSTPAFPQVVFAFSV